MPGLAAALSAPVDFVPAEGGLVALPWFPFEVAAAPACRRAAGRIARRAEQAYWLLRQVLGVAPRVRLVVLDRRHWSQHADTPEYGITHVNHAGMLVTGADPAIAWTAISRWLARHLDTRTLGTLLRVHGVDASTGGPALQDVAESLIAHELAHLACEQHSVQFPRLWLGEAFANYALVAALAENDPAGLRRLGSLAEAGVTLARHTPSLAQFEASFGSLPVVPSVLAQLALTRAVYETYAHAQAAPLARLFRLFGPRSRTAAHIGREPDADHELGRLLARHAHPSLADIPERFAAATLRAAA
jgi:hypothetical protein